MLGSSDQAQCLYHVSRTFVYRREILEDRVRRVCRTGTTANLVGGLPCTDWRALGQFP
jgi:hypothetical protein